MRLVSFISLFAISASAVDIQPLLKTYCLDCHNPDKLKGDVDLTHFGSPQSVQKDFKLWQTMLPAGRGRGNATKEAIACFG
jgi:hypothetical protein